LHKRLIRGIDEVLSSGKLKGKPGIIIAGRNDALIAPNHAARAYYGFNQYREEQSSNLRYYEVTNAHHLDALNALAGFDNLFIPLHHYFTQALDLMLFNLREREPLPPSQVVTTIPRGGLPGEAPPIGIGNVPNIEPSPGSEALIVYNDQMLVVPE
jgi:hydroxybutyrate-dimer hydrolase